jgi:hypothetical protein
MVLITVRRTVPGTRRCGRDDRRLRGAAWRSELEPKSKLELIGVMTTDR